MSTGHPLPQAAWTPDLEPVWRGQLARREVIRLVLKLERRVCDGLVHIIASQSR